MYDVVKICETTDRVAELFSDGEFGEAIATHCTCSEVDRFVELLLATGNHDRAEHLLVTHIKADRCADVHTSLHQPDPPARALAHR
ncbi:hypothetical protein HYG77_38225 (plasmid) [Rhodococcus sp. ZPP]|uniref:hypothetical protein n=1 Tax=Rhodococcus sp. ZPP TaxID=2749906 RepID=UPI001AD89AFD|nr:hypothetical protein [Rhodococcus sp. ZPP]QTJ71286.1 hypothetical protein HYG77_38225 [Rhodococcus sp. ZPP]